MVWSAAALAFCEVSLPAVGEGLPHVGWADASDATANSAAPTRKGVISVQALRLIEYLPSLNLQAPLSSLLRRRLLRSGRRRVSAVICIKSRYDLVGVFLDERQRHTLDIRASIGARSRFAIGNQAAAGTVQREGHRHRDLIDCDDRIGRCLRGDQAT